MKCAVLHEQRTIEPEPCAQFVDVLRRCAFTEHRLHGIAGHEVDQRKHSVATPKSTGIVSSRRRRESGSRCRRLVLSSSRRTGVQSQTHHQFGQPLSRDAEFLCGARPVPAGSHQRGADELCSNVCRAASSRDGRSARAPSRTSAAAPTAAPRHAAGSALPTPRGRSAARVRFRANHIVRVRASVASASARAAADSRRRFAPEVFGQQRDVVAPDAERRQRHPDDVEPIQQVETEAPGRDLRRRSRLVAATTRTSTRRGDVLADAAKLSFLNRHAAPWPAPAATARRSRRETACPCGPPRTHRAARQSPR